MNAEKMKAAMLERLMEDGMIPDEEDIEFELAIIDRLLMGIRGLKPEQEVLLNSGTILRVVAACVDAASGFKA